MLYFKIFYQWILIVFHTVQTENDTGVAQEALNELKEEF